MLVVGCQRLLAWAAFMWHHFELPEISFSPQAKSRIIILKTGSTNTFTNHSKHPKCSIHMMLIFPSPARGFLDKKKS